MNFYGRDNREEHTLMGRLIPLWEAQFRAILKASNQPLSEPKHCGQLPSWVHNICDQFAKTIFKPVVVSAPQGGRFDVRSYGRLIGMLLRGARFFLKDTPALLKREGLLDLSPEREQRLEQFAGIEVLLPVASELLQKPISSPDELLEAGQAQLEGKGKEFISQTVAVLRHLAGRSAEEQHQFLCGIPEGFAMVVDSEGEFSNQSRRYEIFMLLLMVWPEIAEMQRAQPPRTRRDLLDWLERHEGKQLVEDPKVFYELCGDIDLDLSPPGHPRNAGPP